MHPYTHFHRNLCCLKKKCRDASCQFNQGDKVGSIRYFLFSLINHSCLIHYLFAISNIVLVFNARIMLVLYNNFKSYMVSKIVGALTYQQGQSGQTRNPVLVTIMKSTEGEGDLNLKFHNEGILPTWDALCCLRASHFCACKFMHKLLLVLCEQIWERGNCATRFFATFQLATIWRP